MNKLNVFNTQWCPWKYPSNWIRNARLFFRQFKWAYQRMTRGFCDFDTWDLDNYYLELFYQTLNHLAENTHGWPSDEKFPNFEDWQNYLKELADYFYRANDVNDFYEHPAEDKWWNDVEKQDDIIHAESEHIDDMIAEANDLYYKRDNDMREGLDKLKEVFWNLWD